MKKVKNIGLVLLIVFYLIAGINHFRDPSSYYKIIPNYIPLPVFINALAGFFEIFLAILLILPKTRKIAAWGIILMLIAFLPVHISMIGNAPLYLGNLKVTPLMAWIRLLVLQPFLILWAWVYSRKSQVESLKK